MSRRFTESIVEEAALAWLEGLGCAILHGPDIAPGEGGARTPVSPQGIVVARETALGMLD